MESIEQFYIQREPYYQPVGEEVALFRAAFESRRPVLLKGPTGCGKSRFVAYMAWHLKRPLITIACHEDLSASDLVGRYLLKGDETVWSDGLLSLAVKHGALCYLDEVVEARKDTTVILHPLTDDRRILPVEKTGEILTAADGFMLIVSYNPGYQSIVKELKPSTRQRFIAMDFEYPSPAVETQIVAHEADLPVEMAGRLVAVARKIRHLKNHGLDEGAGTRLLIGAGLLIGRGLSPRRACEAAIVSPLTDDPQMHTALMDVVSAIFEAG